jgi:death on curing protein
MIGIKFALVLAVQESQRLQHGGLSGLANPGALESALNRPQQLLAYHPETTVWELAACYAEAIVSAHAFNDVNKRTAFVVAATFLELNGHTLAANQLEVVTTMLSVANQQTSRQSLADWMRRNCEPNSVLR